LSPLIKNQPRHTIITPQNPQHGRPRDRRCRVTRFVAILLSLATGPLMILGMLLTIPVARVLWHWVA